MEGIAVLAGALVIFFPGILALKILEGMTDTRKRSEFDKIAIAVGFSLAIYFAYLGVSFWWKLPHIPVRYIPDGIWPVGNSGDTVLNYWPAVLRRAGQDRQSRHQHSEFRIVML